MKPFAITLLAAISFLPCLHFTEGILPKYRNMGHESPISENIGKKSATLITDNPDSLQISSPENDSTTVLCKKMIDDIKKLPEVENLEVDCENFPSESQPYYTFHAYIPTNEGFTMTIYRFNVYTDPRYEIKFYSSVSDEEFSIEEWRKVYGNLESRLKKANRKDLQIGNNSDTGLPRQGLFTTYENYLFGITAKVRKGEVILEMDTTFIQTHPVWEQTLAEPFTRNTYKVKGLKNKCKGIFTADIGQDTAPILCMLLEDGRVQILYLMHALYNETGHFDFLCSAPLPRIRNITSFKAGGIGAYEEEGEIHYDAMGIYALEKSGKRHEVDIYADPITFTRKTDKGTETVCLSYDYKILLVRQENGNEQNEEGWFTCHYDEKKQMAAIEYQFLDTHKDNCPVKSRGKFYLAQEGDTWKIIHSSGDFFNGKNPNEYKRL